MVKKCSVKGCRSGYALKKREEGETEVGKAVYVNVFHFPSDPDLKHRWIQFTARAEWKPTEHSGICVHHFEEKYLKRSKRVTLNYEMNTVPTIITNPELLSKPSLQPSINTSFRKPPTKRKYDQTEQFKKRHSIKCIEDLNESFCPAGYVFKQMEERVIPLFIF